MYLGTGRVNLAATTVYILYIQADYELVKVMTIAGRTIIFFLQAIKHILQTNSNKQTKKNK